MHSQSKKNKVMVPFYTPPPRLCGQTPADIIKEARAAVMTPPALGIKPVFTNRPFTPKENERTLFGNLKKKCRRPPSSFSFKNDQNQSHDALNHLKLPSIDFGLKKKSHTIFHYSNNLSLDNLAEHRDAETLEKVSEIDHKKSPSWKKSHSCPKEGRMVKAASYNELNQRIFSARDSSWLSTTRGGDDFSLEAQSKEHNKTRMGESYGDTTKAGLNAELYQPIDMARGAGDHDQSNIFIKKNQLASDVSKEFSSILLTNENSEEVYVSNKTESTPVKKSLITESVSCEKQNNDEVIQSNDRKESEKTVKVALNQINVTEKHSVYETKKENSWERKSDFVEKSVATEPKSDYLLSLKKIRSDPSEEKFVESVPLEILELHQMASFYGVDCHENESKSTAESLSETMKWNPKTKDRPNYVEEKINDTDKKDCGNNLNKVEGKRETGPKCTPENAEFVMNNRKKYHLAGEQNRKGEMAYQKWNEKQQSDDVITEKTKSCENWDLFWKNSYYKIKKDDEINVRDTEKVTKNDNTNSMQQLITRSINLNKTGAQNSDIYETNCEIYKLLKSNKTILNSELKNNLLKSLSLCANNEDPKVLLSLARLLFYVKAENSLSAACKMVFKVARFDSNDHLFLNEEDILELFMEGIGRASPLDCPESCIYGYGALKFLTMNYSILSRTLHMGALDLMTLHMKLINTAYAEKGNVDDQTQHSLYQLTGALRHVAAGDGALPLFITTNCISVICKNLELFQKDEDIVINISRTLSLVSTDEAVIEVLISVENILCVIFDLMERYKENDKILIRLSFCLGNIVEHSDLARIQILRNDNSLSSLLNLLKFYIDKDLELATSQDLGGGCCDLTPEVVDDIIVKVIRIIANMSMNPIVGSNLSPIPSEKKSLQLSQLLSVLLLRKDPGMTLLATLGCLNNVSYYCNTHSVLIDITQGIVRVLELPSEVCQAEAARVLGNLTRHKEVRDLILNTGGVNQLIKLLASKDQEVVKCTCGALVNMLLDSDTRQWFLEAKGIDKLVNALELFSGDWSLASLAGRAIWNSCADGVSSAVLNNNVDHLLNILTNSLEEENWNDGDPDWEEFASIATDLLEKINSHLECITIY